MIFLHEIFLHHEILYEVSRLLSIQKFLNNELLVKVGRNAEVFYTDTLEKSKERIPPNIKTGNELQEWLSTELQVSHWDFFYKELFEDYDPNFIGYFGNYIHPK